VKSGQHPLARYQCFFHTRKHKTNKPKEAYFWLEEKKKSPLKLKLLDAVSKTDLAHHPVLPVRCTDSHTTGHLIFKSLRIMGWFWGFFEEAPVKRFSSNAFTGFIGKQFYQTRKKKEKIKINKDYTLYI